MYIQVPQFCLRWSLDFLILHDWFITFLWLLEDALILIFLLCFMLKGILERVHWNRNLETGNGIFFCPKVALKWSLRGVLHWCLLNSWKIFRQRRNEKEKAYGTLFLWMLKFLPIIPEYASLCIKWNVYWIDVEGGEEVRNNIKIIRLIVVEFMIKLNMIRQILTLL
jgi:hypothetical protein